MVTYIFLLHSNSVHITLFNLNKFKKFFFYRKGDIGERLHKTVIWDANYNRENNDYTNALRPRRFKWCDFSTKFT